MEMDYEDPLDFAQRPKRMRLDSQRSYEGVLPSPKGLELDGVLDVLRKYEEYEGGINCSVCGKLYKSKVCFTKHIWEHSIYWDLFEGEKNHDRVLGIQAALILYSGYHGYKMDENNMLSYLLVTGPHEKKKDCSQDNKTKIVNVKVKKSKVSTTPLKRKRRNSATIVSGSDSD
ncbi:unnamed protein product [Owenia fusiformis]|uniref:Uncharacterized protein n=1 Tax=Owenia fusiformis TaxID=6347 RepID=A0A8J1TRR9_OWEFU|nr:unnamed protein product [Owenia fusiformis]